MLKVSFGPDVHRTPRGRGVDQTIASRNAILGIVILTTVFLVVPGGSVLPLVAKTTSRPEIKDDYQVPQTKREEQMNQRVTEFFLQYERANSSSDVSSSGDLYADTFMFGGPQGVQAVKKADFLKVVPKMKSHLSSMGLVKTRLDTVEMHPIDSKYLLVNVGWRMTVRNSSGCRRVDASATYVLFRGQDEELSIVFQIDHQDLASVIKSQQNTR